MDASLNIDEYLFGGPKSFQTFHLKVLSHGKLKFFSYHFVKAQSKGSMGLVNAGWLFSGPEYLFVCSCR